MSVLVMVSLSHTSHIMICQQLVTFYLTSLFKSIFILMCDPAND